MKFASLLRVFTVLLVLVPLSASAHQWHEHPDGDHQQSEPVERPDSDKTRQIFVPIGTKQEADMKDKLDIARHFQQFKNVKVRWDANTLFVETSGLPDHNMMVGIKAWQQQVPLPQPYTGGNAWQIPLEPKLADKPVSAKNRLYRGAIALAVNGVPIFNPLNNRGEDAYLAGELDEWGGHCGRGDDYHYHIAPLHLQEIVGKGNPIAFALDGFPIYGLTEADGSPVGKLDEFNGQFDEEDRYHYHATKTYPYINGGMRGVVTIRGDQIEPQPQDAPLRPALEPLRGATITDFKSTEGQSALTYRLRGQDGTVTYSQVKSDTWKFTYKEPGGKLRTETYQRMPRREDRRGGPPPPPPPRGERPPRR
ncbi:YHYH protein [Adhaeretor mobilis]|uniref:YHYH domain-containing protein n=1 Tax=Adhaeretor mobilis TaxID=1930276 RepID=A0A517MSL2_9BACT|nr:YHYH protein [Adhaeretor mobilis]QDS97874.1 hypothetical protein HG15A2_11420 [Adhaeretor mobilis]